MPVNPYQARLAAKDFIAEVQPARTKTIPYYSSVPEVRAVTTRSEATALIADLKESYQTNRIVATAASGFLFGERVASFVQLRHMGRPTTSGGAINVPDYALIDKAKPGFRDLFILGSGTLVGIPTGKALQAKYRLGQVENQLTEHPEILSAENGLSDRNQYPLPTDPDGKRVVSPAKLTTKGNSRVKDA